MKGNDVKEIIHRVLRGAVWVGRVVLFCFGLLAMLTLVVVASVLTAVMLMATALPATAVSHKHHLRVRPDSTNTSEISPAPRKAVVS